MIDNSKIKNKFILKKFAIDHLQITASKKELIDAGKKQAKKSPISKIGEYHPVKRDAVKMIHTQEMTMIPELLPLRHERMMANAFTFFRGTAGVMQYDQVRGEKKQKFQ